MSEDWRNYLERRRAELLDSIELMEAGKFGTHERRGGEMVDTTADNLARTKENLAEIDRILARP